MKRKLLALSAIATLLIASCAKNEHVDYYQPKPAVDSSHATLSKVLEYNPAPGQYVNETTIGTQAQAQKIAYDSTFANMVSLGAWGGSITFKFDHSVQNLDGADLGIYGNAFSSFDEPGIVMVSQDLNNNGIADDPWFELGGSQYDSTTTIHNYKMTYYNPNGSVDVPWKDNQGNSGIVAWNSFHNHNFYPLETASPNFDKNKDSVTFEGSILRNTVDLTGWGSNNIVKLGWWGYTDTYSDGSSLYTFDNDKTNGYNSVDISWARDNNGKKVALQYVDFVKVYTGQLANIGANGELSTEFKGARDLHVTRL